MSMYLSLRTSPYQSSTRSNPAFLLEGVLPESQITPYHRDPALMSLFPWVYERLNRQIQHHFRRQNITPVDAAALVPGTFTRGVAQSDLLVQERAPYLAVAALAMRQILVAEARRRPTRPGAFDEAALTVRHDIQRCFQHTEGDASWHELLSVHGALKTLAKHKVRWVSLVECRYFAGMSSQDTALALDLDLDEVNQDWQQVTAWLERYLQLKSAAA